VPHEVELRVEIGDGAAVLAGVVFQVGLASVPRSFVSERGDSNAGSTIVRFECVEIWILNHQIADYSGCLRFVSLGHVAAMFASQLVREEVERFVRSCAWRRGIGFAETLGGIGRSPLSVVSCPLSVVGGVRALAIGRSGAVTAIALRGAILIGAFCFGTGSVVICVSMPVSVSATGRAFVSMSMSMSATVPVAVSMAVSMLVPMLMFVLVFVLVWMWVLFEGMIV
jgi:hypothetical protein